MMIIETQFLQYNGLELRSGAAYHLQRRRPMRFGPSNLDYYPETSFADIIPNYNVYKRISILFEVQPKTFNLNVKG